jgi:hypothetical protein
LTTDAETNNPGGDSQVRATRNQIPSRYKNFQVDARNKKTNKNKGTVTEMNQIDIFISIL